MVSPYLFGHPVMVVQTNLKAFILRFQSLLPVLLPPEGALSSLFTEAINRGGEIYREHCGLRAPR
jgi:hypothetical protein